MAGRNTVLEICSERRVSGSLLHRQAGKSAGIYLCGGRDCGQALLSFRSIGIYKQPIEHNRACQLQFTFFYDPGSEALEANRENTAEDETTAITGTETPYLVQDLLMDGDVRLYMYQETILNSYYFYVWEYDLKEYIPRA